MSAKSVQSYEVWGRLKEGNSAPLMLLSFPIHDDASNYALDLDMETFEDVWVKERVRSPAARFCPVLIQRAGNRGWLAVAPPEEIFKIGVTAPTKREAVEKYEKELNRWLAILVSGAEPRL